MAAEFPRCARCRVSIQAGQNVVFRIDGRVQHVECPEVLCPVCQRRVQPGDPIRRDGDNLLHGNCWMRRLRSSGEPGGAARPIAGGAGVSPWSVVPDRALHDRPTPDEELWLTRELWARAAHARERATAIRQQARGH